MAKQVSILITVINETWALEQTVDIEWKENQEHIKEIIIIVSKEKTSAQSFKSIEKLKSRYPVAPIKEVAQDLPFVGGAVRKGFAVASGEYTLLMASDLETDPHLVKDMIARCINKKLDIVATSRWIGDGGFTGYTYPKMILNFIFQTIFGLLYATKLTDMTFGYRIYRTELLQRIKWRSLNHEIFFETLIKPLR